MEGSGDGAITRELKEKAVSFYSQHDVTGSLEKLLNTMFIDSPSDIYGYMSEFFHTLSKDPTISIVEASELLDNNSDHSVSLTLHCVVNGVKKAVCTYTHDLNWPKSEGEVKWSGSKSKPSSGTNNKDSKEAKEAKVSKEESEKEVEDNKEDCSTLTPLETVNRLNGVVNGLSLKSQAEINTCIRQDNEALFNHNVQSGISRLVAISHSTLTDQPLFLSLSESFIDCPSPVYTLPIPLFNTIIGGLGKLKIRGLYLLPSPSLPLMTGFKHILSVYKEMGHALSAKGPPPISKTGAYYYSADKPEALLDLVRDSSAGAGVTLQTDILCIIDIGGELMYDEDKKKYELSSGQWKTSDEMVSILTNLSTAYPWIIGFIDPLHPKNISSWQSLKEHLNNQCLIIADKALLGLSSATIAVNKEVETEGEGGEGMDDAFNPLSLLTSGLLSSTHSQTVKQCFEEAADLKGHLAHIALSALQTSYTCDSLSFDVDLAVALGCSLIKVGAPVGVTSTVILSRLLQVHKRLEALKLLGPPPVLIKSSES